jgi:small subunit ribosomal protein S17e
VDRIKRLSYEVLNGHKSRFGEDFAGNKKALDQISIIRSKGLKNEIAGYITKYIKKEIREEKAKQARIDASKSEQLSQESSEIELTEDSVTEDTSEIVVEATSEDESSEIVEEKSE